MTTLRTIQYALTLFAILTGSLPAFSQKDESASVSTSSSTDTHGKNVSRWKTTNGGTSFTIEARGTVEVTDDDKDIKSMSNDGYLEISKTVFGSKRLIIIESQGNGKLKKEYYEGRTQGSWEPNGREWLGEILPEVVRSTTLGAQGRIDRIYKQGGIPGVLAEIRKINGDHTKAHYGKLLLAKNIPAGELPSLITTLATEIHSDYYLSSILKDNVAKLLTTKDAADVFFKATNQIGSDYYKSDLLKEALTKYAASPAQVKTILQSSANIASDYYLSVVLTALLDQSEVKEESLSEMIVISKNIESAYYRTQVLTKAVQKPGISKPALRSMVDAATGISSDYYQASLYSSMADRAALEADVQAQVITQIATNVHSDYYAASALTSMLKHQTLSNESFRQLVFAAGNLSSAYYSTQVLSEAGEKKLDRTRLLDLLKAGSNINSDNYLSTFLTRIADQVRNSDDAVKDAYRAAAKRINSETYYGRAIKAID